MSGEWEVPRGRQSTCGFGVSLEAWLEWRDQFPSFRNMMESLALGVGGVFRVSVC